MSLDCGTCGHPLRQDDGVVFPCPACDRDAWQAIARELEEMRDEARAERNRLGNALEEVLGLQARIEAVVQGVLQTDEPVVGVLDEGDEDDWPFFDAGPTLGYCSVCGEARDALYTCRKGGATVPDKP